MLPALPRRLHVQEVQGVHNTIGASHSHRAIERGFLDGTSSGRFVPLLAGQPGGFFFGGRFFPGGEGILDSGNNSL